MFDTNDYWEEEFDSIYFDNSTFDSCNISQNSFHLLDLRQMKFLNSLISHRGFEECNLEKAKFSLPEALSFLSLLLIEID